MNLFIILFLFLSWQETRCNWYFLFNLLFNLFITNNIFVEWNVPWSYFLFDFLELFWYKNHFLYQRWIFFISIRLLYIHSMKLMHAWWSLQSLLVSFKAWGWKTLKLHIFFIRNTMSLRLLIWRWWSKLFTWIWTLLCKWLTLLFKINRSV
jgi:hypothetical protein